MNLRARSFASLVLLFFFISIKAYPQSQAFQVSPNGILDISKEFEKLIDAIENEQLDTKLANQATFNMLRMTVGLIQGVEHKNNLKLIPFKQKMSAAQFAKLYQYIVEVAYQLNLSGAYFLGTTEQKPGFLPYDSLAEPEELVENLKLLVEDLKNISKFSLEIKEGRFELPLGLWIAEDMIDESCEGEDRLKEILRVSPFQELYIQSYKFSSDREAQLERHDAWSLPLNTETLKLLYRQSLPARLKCTGNSWYHKAYNREKQVEYDQLQHAIILTENNYVLRKRGPKNNIPASYLNTAQIVAGLEKILSDAK